MRFLAIDLGQKRTGLATGDDITHIVQPYRVISATPGDALLDALTKAVDDVGPDLVVMGLPLNMDGSEGPAAAGIRAFAASLRQRMTIDIAFQDERLSSFAAEQHLNRSGRTHQEKKELRDALAAAEILRDYLSGRLGRSRIDDDETADDAS